MVVPQIVRKRLNANGNEMLSHKRVFMENELCKNVFQVFVKEERKRFGKVKMDFVRFGVHKRSGQARSYALKINNYIANKCKGYLNDPQAVLVDYISCMFDKINRNPDFWRFNPNSFSISAFEQYVWESEEADGRLYFKRKKKEAEQDAPEVSHFEQIDNDLIQSNGFILATDNELMER